MAVGRHLRSLSPPLSLTRPLRSVSFSFCKRVPSRKRRAVASREKYKRRGNAVLSPFPDQKSFPTLCDESNKKNSRTLSRDVSDYSLSLPPSSLSRSLALLFLSLLLPHAFETSRERERNEQKKKKFVLNIKKEGRKNYKNKNGYSFSLSFSLSLSLFTSIHFPGCSSVNWSRGPTSSCHASNPPWSTEILIDGWAASPGPRCCFAALSASAAAQAGPRTCDIAQCTTTSDAPSSSALRRIASSAASPSAPSARSSEAGAWTASLIAWVRSDCRVLVFSFFLAEGGQKSRRGREIECALPSWPISTISSSLLLYLPECSSPRRAHPPPRAFSRRKEASSAAPQGSRAAGSPGSRRTAATTSKKQRR